MKNPHAAQKVIAHIVLFKRSWKALQKFLGGITRDYWFALEWPKGCGYSKYNFVEKFLEERELVKYHFDGCMFGAQDGDGQPIKEPWMIATDCEVLGLDIAQYLCDGSHQHVQGRGTSLKHIESYTDRLVDLIHSNFKKLSNPQSNPATSIVCFAVPAMTVPHRDVELHERLMENARYSAKCIRVKMI